MKQTNSFNSLSFLKKLVALGERQLENETKAKNLIIKYLAQYKIPFQTQEFQVKIPTFIKSELTADGQIIPSYPSSFVSGKITGKDSLQSALLPVTNLKYYQANLNFNPYAKILSRATCYFAPAVTFPVKYLSKIIQAKTITAQTETLPVDFVSANILVGNMENPKNILFCHYDSIGPGAIDNASGTAVLMDLIINHPETTRDNLFVIAGSEEYSYDEPLYWGAGYRAFEHKYYNLMDLSQAIWVVDCIGNGKPNIDSKPDIIKLAFPIVNLSKWINKIKTVDGDIEQLMTVYHSESDTAKNIKKEYLDETVSIIKQCLR